ncbi:MAG: hypothetical protein KF716_15280 [Anaerolineae bacterium]|nr:hypothetical protein [Anaerolineae bacterium]
MDNQPPPPTQTHRDSLVERIEPIVKSVEQFGTTGERILNDSLYKAMPFLLKHLVNLAGLTAFLTITGFFTIHSYLAKYSTLATHNVSATQYLSAGLSMLVTLAIFICNNIGLGVIVGIVLGVLFTLFNRFIISIDIYIYNIKENIEKALKEGTGLRINLYESLTLDFGIIFLRIAKVLLQSSKILWKSAWLIMVAFFVLFGFIYGQRYYDGIDHALGGGKPAEIYLIFKDKNQAGVWPFQVTGVQSTKLKVLIELTDGIMVYDENTNTTTIVKNDVVAGIIDAQSTPIPSGIPATSSSTLVPTSQSVISPTP